MVFRRNGWGQRVWLGAQLAVLAGLCSVARSQPQTSTPQQQQIPDAPKPQALPKLNTITPVGPALPTAPAPAADAQQAPGATLPPSQKTAAEAAEDADQGPPPAAHATSDIVERVTYVDVPFTVKDSHGALVPGLTWRDVRVFENGVREIPRVFSTDAAPLSVALVIDQSVTYDNMEKINNSLAALQGAFTPYDEIAVFTYNNGVREQGGAGFTAAQSARLAAILERSKAKGNEPVAMLGGPLSQTTTKNNEGVDPNTSPNHGTSVGTFDYAPREFHTLNDAILSAAQQASKAAKGRRRIVYVISDGKEYGSTAKEKEVIRYCQANKVAVYATLVGDSAVPVLGFLDRVHLPFTMRDNALPRYTAATGGEFDLEFRQGGIEKSFARISEEVRTQYTVGYYSHESPLDSKFRKIEVRVLRPNLTVIAKEGYYPTASDNRPTPVTPTAIP